MTSLSDVLLLGDPSRALVRTDELELRVVGSVLELLEEHAANPATTFCIDARQDKPKAIRRFCGLRAIEDVENIPVIALIEQDQWGARAELMRYGFAACVTSISALCDLRVEWNVIGHKGRIYYFDLELDPEQYKVWRGGRLINLTTFQFRLLKFFMTYPSKIFSRQELLRSMWHDQDLNEGAVTACMARLRRALAQPGAPDLIRNARGGGYSLDVDAGQLNARLPKQKKRTGNKSVTRDSPQCHGANLVDSRPGG